jgi:hypothetical protein
VNITENRTYVRAALLDERERSYDHVLTLDFEAKFWSKVNLLAPNGCWEWVGSSETDDGYGVMRLAGRTVRTHRVVFATYVGELLVDKVVRHKCDNPPCVNPAHLELGTPRENVADREHRLRSRHFRKFSPAERRNAVERLRSGESSTSIALDIGCHSVTPQRWAKGGRYG